MYQQRAIQRITQIPAQHSATDQCIGVYRGNTQRFATGILYHHLLTGLESLQRCGLVVHFVAVDPEVASPKAAVCIVLKLEGSEIHRIHML